LKKSTIYLPSGLLLMTYLKMTVKVEKNGLLADILCVTDEYQPKRSVKDWIRRPVPAV
jgi:hypothetical protein